MFYIIIGITLFMAMAGGLYCTLKVDKKLEK